MEIKLNPEEYEKLVKLVYLGMWVADSNETTSANFAPIEQLVYSNAEQINDQKIIEFDPVDQTYYPSEDFDTDDSIANAIESYEETCFWDELIDKFTKRDMIKAYGLERIHQMSQDEIFENEKKFIEKYENIFQKNGLDNVQIT